MLSESVASDAAAADNKEDVEEDVEEEAKVGVPETKKTKVVEESGISDKGASETGAGDTGVSDKGASDSAATDSVIPARIKLNLPPLEKVD